MSTTKTAATTTWAAYDDQAIWGTGPTKAAALRDVAQWVNPEDVARTRRGCGVAIMTEALAARVAASGGNCRFGLMPDNRLGTGEEWDDEHNPPPEEI